VTANWCIGKDQKSTQSSGADAPQSMTSQAPPKKKAPKSTKTQPKRQKTVPSSPPHLVPRTPTAPSSLPHPAPQIQADVADVSEQVTDPVDLGTSSAVPPERTIVIPPQGKVPIIKLLPMALL